jgi:hypothetical protein
MVAPSVFLLQFRISVLTNQLQNRNHVNTRNAWIFFGITVLEAIANCALEAVLFWLVASEIDIKADRESRTIPTYLAIYILAL